MKDELKYYKRRVQELENEKELSEQFSGCAALIILTIGTILVMIFGIK